MHNLSSIPPLPPSFLFPALPSSPPSPTYLELPLHLFLPIFPLSPTHSSPSLPLPPLAHTLPPTPFPPINSPFPAPPLPPLLPYNAGLSASRNTLRFYPSCCLQSSGMNQQLLQRSVPLAVSGFWSSPGWVDLHTYIYNGN